MKTQRDHSQVGEAPSQAKNVVAEAMSAVAQVEEAVSQAKIVAAEVATAVAVGNTTEKGKAAAGVTAGVEVETVGIKEAVMITVTGIRTIT